MAGTNPIAAFDSGIWITWLKDGRGDNLHDDVLPAINQMIQAMLRRELVIVTNALALGEVLDCDLEQGIRDKIGKYSSRYLQISPADQPVILLSRDLRLFYGDPNNRPTGSKKGLCTVDAIHIATAILSGAKTLYTLDKRDKRDCMGLVGLGGGVLAKRWKLTIEEPRTGNIAAPLFEGTSEKKD